jgi:basic amino acid/polyamine antiporter, APA family
MGSTVVSGPRYLFALARDGFGPAFLAREDAHRGTPVAAIVTLSLLALPLALTGTFVGLASLSVIARLSVYVSTAAAVPVLRRKLASRVGALRIPGGLLVPVGAVLVCVYLLGSATRIDLLGGAAGLVVGAMVFTTRRRPGSART